MKNFKPILLLPIFLLACHDRHGTLEYERHRIRQAGGPANDAGKDIVVDRQENTYITGVFSDSATFDDTLNLKSEGEEDIFVAKYDNAGKRQWAINIGGLHADAGHAIAVDASGAIGIVGSMQDELAPAARSLTSPAFSDDIFVARYDADGKPLWRVLAGGAGSDKGTDAAFDSAGNCFVTGFFSRGGEIQQSR